MNKDASTGRDEVNFAQRVASMGAGGGDASSALGEGTRLALERKACTMKGKRWVSARALILN